MFVCILFTECKLMIVDIDECSGRAVHGCHICVNTLGGYHCVCNPGYTLDANRTNCTGNSTVMCTTKFMMYCVFSCSMC